MSRSISLKLFNKEYTVRILYILLMFVVIGAFLRFNKLTHVSLWLDEIYSMQGAAPSATLSDIYEYSKYDQPPFFFVLLNGWLRIFGHTDYAGRAMTCVLGLLCIPAIYFLGKELQNEKLGLVAAFITTFNWFHIGVSVEIRFYALVFLLTTLSYLFFLRSIKRSGILDFVGYALFTALLLNTHYFGMVVFASQFLLFILVILFFKRDGRFIISALVAGLVVAASFVHWIPVILHDLKITNFHVKPVSYKFAAKFAQEYFNDPITFYVCFICAFLALRRIWQMIRKHDVRIEGVLIAGWIFLGFAIPLTYSLLRIPLMTPKYCSITLPAIFLVVAFGLGQIKNEINKTAGIAAILIGSCIALFITKPAYAPSWQEDWREVGAFFKAQNEGKQVIFSQLAWFHEYYFKKYDLKFPVDQNLVDFNDQIKDANKVWLLLHNHYTGGWPIIGFSNEQKERIKNEFQLVDSVTFRKSKAFLYERKGARSLLSNQSGR